MKETICDFCGRIHLAELPVDAQGRHGCCGAMPAGAWTGRSFGDFTIVAELGRGNRGIVYLARQQPLDRLVALKILNGPDTRAEADFFAEARLTAGLNHPNIVQAIAAGHSGDVDFLAMEWVPGTTLEDELVKDRKLKLPEVLQIAVTVADALNYAWERCRMIHGDIKPANLLLRRNDRVVKLADLGLASVGGGSGRREGTPLYVAPEIIRPIEGQERDFRADIYSFGIVLYELLTGTPPFSGTPEELVEKQLHAIPPPLDKTGDDFPPELVHLVASMLAKAPEGRPRSWLEVREAIAPLLHRSRPVALPPQSRPGSSPVLLIVVALSALGFGIGLGGVILWQVQTRSGQVSSPAAVTATISKPEKAVPPPAALKPVSYFNPESEKAPLSPPPPVAVAPKTPAVSPPPVAVAPKKPAMPKPVKSKPQIAAVKAPPISKPVTPPPAPAEVTTSGKAAAVPVAPPPVVKTEAPALPPPPAAFFRAARQGKVAELRTLLKQSFNLNAADSTGNTALMYAAFRGREEVVMLLLDHGADPAVANAETGQTAYELADGFPAIQLMLRQKTRR